MYNKGTYYYPHRGDHIDHIDHIEGPIASNIVPMVSYTVGHHRGVNYNKQ